MELVQPGDVEVHLERLVLPAEGVALDDDIHRTELGLRVAGGALRQENHPCTRAVGGEPVCYRLLQWLEQTEDRREAADGGRLTAGDDDGVDPIEVGRASHLDDRSPNRFQQLAMLADSHPASARTPTRVNVPPRGSPPALLQPLRLRQGPDLDAGHRLAQPVGDLGEDIGIHVVGGGLDDGAGVLRRDPSS